jgi:hypothetical protein
LTGHELTFSCDAEQLEVARPLKKNDPPGLSISVMIRFLMLVLVPQPVPHEVDLDHSDQMQNFDSWQWLLQLATSLALFG